MADKKGITIVIKKVQGGHAAAHGGAWKVAYADFVTAMMAFFLVMWLLGSDEETKSSVSNYFNNPTSAWRKDLTTKETVPLGDMTGAGEALLQGADGQVPEDLVQRPSRITKSNDGENTAGGLDSLLNDQQLLEVEMVQFSVPESLLFQEGTIDAWTPKAQEVLGKLGKMAAKYGGNIAIKASFDRTAAADSKAPGSYEHQMARSVSVGKFLVDNNLASEEHVNSSVIEGAANRAVASDDSPAPVRRIEFVLTKKRN